MPMVARDGLHYGATIEMPGDGHYKLTYAIKPPSAGGLGRHVDPATGVEPWWKPFEVSFDWDFNRRTPVVTGKSRFCQGQTDTASASTPR